VLASGPGAGETRSVTEPAAAADSDTELSPEPDADGWRRGWPPMSYWARVTLTVVAVLTVLAALWSVFNIVILILMAAVLAIGLDPAVRALQRRDRSRGGSVALIFAGVLAFALVFALLIVPPLVRQVGELADNIPTYIDRLGQRDDALGRYFRDTDLAEKLEKFVADLPSKITSSFGTVVGVAGRVTSAIFNLVTVAILTVYFMLSLPRMRRTASLAFPEGEPRELGEVIMDQSVSRIGGYVAGNLVTSVICGVTALVVFTILGVFGIGVPFAFPLAMWAGIADLIPAVGAYLGAAPAVIVGFFQSPVTGVLLLVYFAVYQQVENYVIVPRVMKNAVNLSPAAVIISTLIFGSLFGFAGALLALPAAATIKVVLLEGFHRVPVAEGDPVPQETQQEHHRAEAEAVAEATARAKARKRMIRRLRDRFGKKPRG
jgi:predicted PurR-regulated permease PerM